MIAFINVHKKFDYLFKEHCLNNVFLILSPFVFGNYIQGNAVFYTYTFLLVHFF